MSKKGKISVFVIDRSQLSREGLESLLAGSNDMKYVGGADGSKGTLESLKKSSPDIVLITVNTSSPKEVGICYEIVKENPNTKMLCFLTEASRGIVDECMTAKAMGIMVEECSFEELTGAIRKLSDGEQYFGPNIAAILANNYADQMLFGSKQTKVLTDRERNIIRLTANGKSLAQIAEAIGKTYKTAELARHRIKTKLGISTTIEFIRFAVKHGIDSLD